MRGAFLRRQGICGGHSVEASWGVSMEMDSLESVKAARGTSVWWRVASVLQKELCSCVL